MRIIQIEQVVKSNDLIFVLGVDSMANFSPPLRSNLLKRRLRLQKRVSVRAAFQNRNEKIQPGLKG